jgi:hypothetical protein
MLTASKPLTGLSELISASMIEVQDEKYPTHHVMKVHVHPKAGNISKKVCPCCTMSKTLYGMSCGQNFSLSDVFEQRVAKESETGLYFIMSIVKGDIAASYYGSEYIDFCPKCGKRL